MLGVHVPAGCLACALDCCVSGEVSSGGWLPFSGQGFWGLGERITCIYGIGDKCIAVQI